MDGEKVSGKHISCHEKDTGNRPGDGWPAGDGGSGRGAADDHTRRG